MYIHTYIYIYKLTCVYIYIYIYTHNIVHDRILSMARTPGPRALPPKVAILRSMADIPAMLGRILSIALSGRYHSKVFQGVRCRVDEFELFTVSDDKM